MKKLISALLCMILAMGAVPMAMASNGERVDLGDGFYMIIESPQQHSTFTYREDSKSGTVYYGNTKVGTIKVTGEFYYDKSIVRIESKSCTGTGANGWTASNNYATGSGGTVTGYCTFSKGSSKTTGNISITCDKNGNIS